MGEPLICYIIREPVTYFLAGVFLLAHLYTSLSRSPIFEKFGYHYESVRRGEVWRIFTHTLLHGGLVHLALNLSSLLSLGIESGLGSLVYSVYTVLLAALAGAIMVAAQSWLRFLPEKYLEKDKYCVGFSGVLFGWITFVCLKTPTATVRLPGIGTRIPALVQPIYLLVLIHVLVPQASYIGHFSGIVSGALLLLGHVLFSNIGNSVD